MQRILLTTITSVLVSIIAIPCWAGPGDKGIRAFTTPNLTFSPVNSATGVAENTTITITSDVALRNLDNSALDDSNIAARLSLKVGSAAGANIPFTANFDEANDDDVVITPSSLLPSNTVIYVEIRDVENSNDAISPNPTSITFTTGDTQAPTITFNPLNSATGVSVSNDLTITFSEAVRKIDDSPITAGDLSTLVELKLTDNSGANVPFSATIDGTNKIITINPTSNLTSLTVYYLEINPVEDAANNAISASNITFTTADVDPPVPTFSPVNSATGVVESNDITITFNEAIRKLDDSPITVGDLATLVELKLTDNAGASVPFTASINGGNTVITINPTANLAPNTVYYVEINPVEDASNNAITSSSITFTTGNTLPPDITFTPLNGAVNVSVSSNLTITFSEAIRKLDDSPITAGDLATLVELKLTDNAGAAVPFTASINGANTVITIDPTSNLGSATVYYLEINPVEDGNNNATTASNITFTTADVAPPTITFNPVNTATGVAESANLTITFNEPVRRLDDGAITSGDLSTLVELKLTNNAGASVPFTATIDGTNQIITIDPTSNLSSSTLYYLEINPVEDASNNAITATSITFTTGDTQAPTVTFNPANSATNVSAVGNITITFNEAVRKIDNSAITSGDLSTLVELKLTNNAGASVPFSATIDGTNTVITIDPSSTLTFNQVYYVEINPVEDAANNAITAQNITFTVENRPSISGFTPAAGTCIGDDVTVNGSRFTGTGSPSSGNSQPTVTVNGVTIPAANIVSFNSTQVVFTLPAGSTTGAITVRNNDSDLVSAASSSLSVFPAINQALTVTPATFFPAQNTNVNVTIGSAQNGYTYDLILTAAPATFVAEHSLTLPDIAHQATGTGANLVLNTSEGTDPDFTKVGDYTYSIEVSRTGCTTRTLDDTPFTLTVAALSVTASATQTSICAGSSTTLIGSTSGGTGYYQFSWSSNPVGFSSNNSSPTVSPTVNTQYILTLTDNSSNTDTDFVDITVNPVPTATIDPGPSETTVRTNYTIENADYRLYGSPAGGVFTGQGVTLKNDGFYYFNPQNAGTGNWPITYTYTNGFGCADSDMVTFRVNNSVVDGLEQIYCKNRTSDSPIAYNVSTFPAGYQFTRLVFYAYNYSTFTACIAESAPTFTFCGAYNPLSVNSTTPVPDIQAGVTLPVGTMFNQPVSYNLDLNGIRNNYGYTYNGLTSTGFAFYILVYGKDASGVERYLNAQYFRVEDNGPAPTIIGIDENQNICSDATSIQLTSSEPGYTINNFSVTQAAYSAALSGTNNEDFNPSHTSLMTNNKEEEFLQIRMDYSDFNSCPSSVYRNFNWVRKPDAPIVADTSFCQFVNPDALAIQAFPNGPSNNPYWYELDPGSNPSAEVLDSINFTYRVTEIDGQSPANKTYYVRQQYKGCKGNVQSVNIEIKPAPNATFTTPAICQDREFVLQGPLDVSNGNLPYPLYEWNFGDGNIKSRTNSDTVTHTYNAPTQFTITLFVTSSEGCQNSSFQNPTVGLNPIPDFSWRFLCDGDLTEFTATTNIPVADFEWDFTDATIPRAPKTDPAPEGGSIQNPHHEFTLGPQVYDVTVTSYTGLGCFNSTTKQLTILPRVTATTAAPYIMSDLDGGRGFFTIEDINGNSTWEFSTPTTTVLQALGTNAWVTNATGDYQPNEKSYLNSPCFDISAVDRPVMTLDFAMNTQDNADGVVVEFSKNGGVNWFPLGNTTTGANWFNTSNFFSGTIGSSTVGWSGNSTELNDNLTNDVVVQGRRSLDNLPNLSLAERANVRFRIVFQSNGDRELEGFAFSDLKIESRNRTLLVENFTNENDPDYNANNGVFTGISPTESVKIQYHLGYPAADNNSRINSSDQSARAAYYGVALTENSIPRAYIDGVSGGQLVAPWATTRFDKRSLVSAPINLTVESEEATPGYFRAKVTIEALQDINYAGKLIVHIAAVEKTVGTNQFVLRKLIPSPIGTEMATIVTFPMPQGTIAQFSDSVLFDFAGVDVNDLALIAFIQDEQTKEVFQAAIELNPAYPPTVITDADDEDYSSRIQLFPNPADEVVNVILPNAVNKATPVVLSDSYGRAVYQNTIEAGKNQKTIETKDLRAGMYFLQIQTPQGGIARKKVLIVHD